MIYIAILAVVTILTCLLHRPWRIPQGLLIIIPCAIMANMLYLAGPALDTYIRWLGYRENWPRFAMFVSGTALSALLAVMVVWEAF